MRLLVRESEDERGRVDSASPVLEGMFVGLGRDGQECGELGDSKICSCSWAEGFGARVRLET